MTLHPTVGVSLRLTLLALVFLFQPAMADPAAAPSDSIPHRVFGKIPHGPLVTLYTLTNKNGMSVSVMDYGATIVNLMVPDRAGKLDNVVLGFDRFAPYLTAKDSFGATLGRYANRIARGQFTLQKTSYQLACNDGPNALNGGARGFDKRMWNFEAVESDTPAVRFTYLSKDGEEGYPGNLFVSVTFVLTDDNELRVSYHATTDKATVLNLTNHSCFNLAGVGSILDETLTIHANSFTPVDAALIPSGEIKPVAGTPFDFHEPTVIGQRLKELKPPGYDCNFVLNKGYFSDWALAAVVDDPQTGRRMEISTDQPGLQFSIGKDRKPPYAGLVLESQHYPDSPNHDDFPSTILLPGDDFKSTTVYAFSTH